jgi:hypothetical protein
MQKKKKNQNVIPETQIWTFKGVIFEYDWSFREASLYLDQEKQGRRKSTKSRICRIVVNALQRITGRLQSEIKIFIK